MKGPRPFRTHVPMCFRYLGLETPGYIPPPLCGEKTTADFFRLETKNLSLVLVDGYPDDLVEGGYAVGQLADCCFSQ